MRNRNQLKLFLGENRPGRSCSFLHERARAKGARLVAKGARLELIGHDGVCPAVRPGQRLRRAPVAKYECVYPRAFADVHALNRGLTEYFVWYNTDRPHQGLDGATPDEVYFADRSLQEAA